MAGNGRFVKGQHWRQPQPHWSKEWLHQQYVVLGRSTGNPALRFAPDNAATLCRPCHQWVHSKANVAGDFL
jgi:hypothetical protein